MTIQGETSANCIMPAADNSIVFVPWVKGEKENTRCKRVSHKGREERRKSPF